MWPFTKKTKKKETVVEKKETEEKVFEEKNIKLNVYTDEYIWGEDVKGKLE